MNVGTQLYILFVSFVLAVMGITRWYFQPTKISVRVETQCEPPLPPNPHMCEHCGRGYRAAIILHFHLYGKDGNGHHGRLPLMKPLDIDGESCVTVLGNECAPSDTGSLDRSMRTPSAESSGI